MTVELSTLWPEKSASFPMSITVTHSPIKIGVIHGHQCIPTGDLDSLSSIARQMDVDVLISGHTHTCVLFASRYDHQSLIESRLIYEDSKPSNMMATSLSTRDPQQGPGPVHSLGTLPPLSPFPSTDPLTPNLAVS